MGCKCGSQIILCNLPVRFDTYRGCSHGCRYCFAQKKNDISHIERDESVDGLRSFIEGKRGNETEWCDWNIPIHWGGMSDPFQPVEKQIRASYECLKLLAETKYPFVVSTKGRLVADPEYLDLLAQCNCVLQVRPPRTRDAQLRGAAHHPQDGIGQSAAHHRPHPAVYARGVP